MGHVLNTARSSPPRSTTARFVGLVTAAFLVFSLAGCGGDDSASAVDGEGTGVVVYFVEDGAVKPTTQKSSKKIESMRPQGRAVLAVKALLEEEPAEDAAHTTYWGRECVTGASVKSLTHNAGQVTLTLGGAGGRVCAKQGQQDELQRQQLAWTIVDNLEVDASTPVKVIGQNGAVIWEALVADESMLAG